MGKILATLERERGKNITKKLKIHRKGTSKTVRSRSTIMNEAEFFGIFGFARFFLREEGKNWQNLRLWKKNKKEIFFSFAILNYWP